MEHPLFNPVQEAAEDEMISTLFGSSMPALARGSGKRAAEKADDESERAVKKHNSFRQDDSALLQSAREEAASRVADLIRNAQCQDTATLRSIPSENSVTETLRALDQDTNDDQRQPWPLCRSGGAPNAQAAEAIDWTEELSTRATMRAVKDEPLPDNCDPTTGMPTMARSQSARDMLTMSRTRSSCDAIIAARLKNVRRVVACKEDEEDYDDDKFEVGSSGSSEGVNPGDLTTNPLTMMSFEHQRRVKEDKTECKHADHMLSIAGSAGVRALLKRAAEARFKMLSNSGCLELMA